MEKVLIWGVLCVVIAVACFWKPKPTRAVVGVFFAIMGLAVHGGIILTNPQTYVSFAGGAVIPIYRDMALTVVQVSPLIFGIIMLVFELVVAGLILSRGRAVKLGLLAAILFLIGIMPLGKEEWPDPILAAGLAYLMTKDYPASVPREVFSWLRRHRHRSALGRLGRLRS
jgi:hypothetical protein